MNYRHFDLKNSECRHGTACVRMLTDWLFHHLYRMNGKDLGLKSHSEAVSFQLTYRPPTTLKAV